MKSTVHIFTDQLQSQSYLVTKKLIIHAFLQCAWLSVQRFLVSSVLLLGYAFAFNLHLKCFESGLSKNFEFTSYTFSLIQNYTGLNSLCELLILQYLLFQVKMSAFKDSKDSVETEVSIS